MVPKNSMILERLLKFKTSIVLIHSKLPHLFPHKFTTLSCSLRAMIGTYCVVLHWPSMCVSSPLQEGYYGGLVLGLRCDHTCSTHGDSSYLGLRLRPFYLLRLKVMPPYNKRYPFLILIAMHLPCPYLSTRGPLVGLPSAVFCCHAQCSRAFCYASISALWLVILHFPFHLTFIRRCSRKT